MRLHVFAKADTSSEDSAALGTRVLPLTFVLDLMSVQQSLRGKEDAAEFTVIRQRKIFLVILIVYFLLYDVLFGIHRNCCLVSRVHRFRALRRGLRRFAVLLHQIKFREHRVIVFRKR